MLRCLHSFEHDLHDVKHVKTCSSYVEVLHKIVQLLHIAVGSI